MTRSSIWSRDPAVAGGWVVLAAIVAAGCLSQADAQTNDQADGRALAQTDTPADEQAAAADEFEQAAVVAPPLFTDHTPLELRIEAPLRQLRREGRRRPEHASQLSYTTADGREVILPVDIRVRGNSRIEICTFPPLRLDFDRDQLAGTVFDGQNRLKLVTLCRSQDDYEDYLHLEYQIYLLFNLLTDYSFRARWASIEYLSTDARRAEPFTEPGFLIEDEDEVAARHGLDIIEKELLSLSELNPRHTTLLALFQFMIGNTDWGRQAPEGESCCHNGTAIGSSETGAIILPYDFDMAGLIATEYAEPNPRLPLRSVRQRLYFGYCVTNAEIGWAVGRFNEEREAMVAVLNSGPVSEDARNQALDYLQEFFAIINDPLRLQTDIVERCRGQVEPTR